MICTFGHSTKITTSFLQESQWSGIQPKLSSENNWFWALLCARLEEQYYQSGLGSGKIFSAVHS